MKLDEILPVPKRLRVPLILTLLGLLFFADLLLHPTRVLYSDHSDLLAMHLPAKRFLVRELHATGVDAHQLEGGTGDRSGRPNTARDAADKGRLASAKLADEQDHVAGAEAPPQALAGSLGLGGGISDLLRQSGRSR